MHPFRTPLLLMTTIAALAACGSQAPQAGETAPAPAGAALQAVAASAPGATGDRAVIIDAFERLGRARSYRMVTEGNEASAQEYLLVEFVAPDRVRATNADGAQTIIGSDMYLQIEGQVMKHPLRPGALDGLVGMWQHAARMMQLASMSVQVVGNERIDGQDASKYRVSNPELGSEVGLLWISNGYPLRIDWYGEDGQHGGQDIVSMRFSRIDDPSLRIDPPG
jgi:hypothetical protein